MFSRIVCLLLFLGVCASQNCDDNLLLHGGKIHASHTENIFADFLRVRGGRITEVGFGIPTQQPCEVPIFLANRTVIPGIIDAHTHTTGFGGPTGIDFNVGYYFRELDQALSKEDILDGLRERIQQVPVGSWIFGPQTIHSVQYGGDNVIPTQQELDMIIRNSGRPGIKVFIQSTNAGPAIVSSDGETWIRELDPTITFNPLGNNPGQIGTGSPASAAEITRATDALDYNKTFEERVSIRHDFYSYAASLGVTGIIDYTPIDGVLDGTFEPLLAMFDRKTLPIRVREYVQNYGNLDQFFAAYEMMVENQFLPNDPMLKFVGFGERVIGGVQSPAYDRVLEHIASNQLNYVQHVTSMDAQYFLSKWQNISQFYDISNLRFSFAHPGGIDRLANAGLRAQLIRNNGGVNAQTVVRVQGTGAQTGFKTLSDAFRVDGQQRFSIGSDGPYTHGVFHPWLAIDFVVNGLDSRGNVRIPINERLSVREALEAYSTGAAWLGHYELECGDISVGKYADLVVLDRDIFDPNFDTRNLKRVDPLMTMVGGNIVHDTLKERIKGM